MESIPLNEAKASDLAPTKNSAINNYKVDLTVDKITNEMKLLHRHESETALPSQVWHVDVYKNNGVEQKAIIKTLKHCKEIGELILAHQSHGEITDSKGITFKVYRSS